MTKFLLASLHHTDDNLADFMQRWEEFLYKVIVAAGNKEVSDAWVILSAACTPDERAALQEQRLVATTCRSRHIAEANDNSNDTMVVVDDADDDDCCSFFDPVQKAFVPRRRRNDDDDD